LDVIGPPCRSSGRWCPLCQYSRFGQVGPNTEQLLLSQIVKASAQPNWNGMSLAV